MIKTQYSRLLTLLFVCLAAGSSPVHAQARSKHACSNSKTATFTITCKDRYYLGEPVTITFANNNTGRTLRTVKEFEHEKFSVALKGFFSESSDLTQKKINYDGSIYIPPSKNEGGGLISWYAPVVRPPKYVTLRPGESTSFTVDLAGWFSAGLLPLDRYTLVFKSQDGHKLVKEFEVYFDNEKTVPLMVKVLQTGDLTERNTAIHYLSRFARPVLRRTVEELIATGNEEQRVYASSLLADIKGGRFNPLELVLITPARYSRGANPSITISLRNRSDSAEPVKDAQEQKFFLELRKVADSGKPSEHYEDTKTCVYTPKQPQQNLKLITLGPGESSSLELNLQACLGTILERGDYQLIVKSDRDEQIREQSVERRFQIRGR